MESSLLRGVRFTPREKELRALLARGLSNKQAAHEMGVSLNTLKVCCNRLYFKVGITNAGNPRVLVALDVYRSAYE